MGQNCVWVQNVSSSNEIEKCKIRFIKWRKENRRNAREEINMIQQEMEKMQKIGEDRNWNRWKQLKTLLDEAYKSEEDYWRRKSRINWLQVGIKIQNFSMQSRLKEKKKKQNYCDQEEDGTECRDENGIANEIANYFENLFTTSSPRDCQELLDKVPRTISESMSRSLT